MSNLHISNYESKYQNLPGILLESWLSIYFYDNDYT